MIVLEHVVERFRQEVTRYHIGVDEHVVLVKAANRKQPRRQHLRHFTRGWPRLFDTFPNENGMTCPVRILCGLVAIIEKSQEKAKKEKPRHPSKKSQDTHQKTPIKNPIFQKNQIKVRKL